MSNKFCKIYEFGEHQLLLKKINDETGDEFPLLIETFKDGAFGSFTIGFPDEEAREEAMESINDEKAKEFYLNLINFL